MIYTSLLPAHSFIVTGGEWGWLCSQEGGSKKPERRLSHTGTMAQFAPEYSEDEEYTADKFLVFLKKVVETYPTGKIVMVLDNARIHHAKLLEPFLEEQQGRLEFVFLPPYSPELNYRRRSMEMAKVGCN
jgi:hypothetical protein